MNRSHGEMLLNDKCINSQQARKILAIGILPDRSKITFCFKRELNLQNKRIDRNQFNCIYSDRSKMRIPLHCRPVTPKEAAAATAAGSQSILLLVITRVRQFVFLSLIYTLSLFFTYFLLSYLSFQFVAALFYFLLLVPGLDRPSHRHHGRRRLAGLSRR